MKPKFLSTVLLFLFCCNVEAQPSIDSVVHDLQKVLPGDWIVFKTHDGLEIYRINYMKQEAFEKAMDGLHAPGDTTLIVYDRYPVPMEDTIRQLIRSIWADSVYYSTGLSLPPPEYFTSNEIKRHRNGIVCLKVRFNERYDANKVKRAVQWNDSLKVIYSGYFTKGSRDAYYYLNDQFNDYRYWLPKSHAVNKKLNTSLAAFQPVAYCSVKYGTAVYLSETRPQLKDHVMFNDTDDYLRLIRAYLLLRLGVN